MSSQLHQNNTGPVIEAVERLTKATQPQLFDLPGNEGHKAFIDSNGRVRTLKEAMDEHRKVPERVKGSETLHDLPSFLAECKRWAGEALTIFIDVLKPDAARVIAVTNGAHPEKPNWADHFLIYAPSIHPKLAAWRAAANPMDQGKFARFVEDRLCDVRSRGPLAEIKENKEHAENPSVTVLLDAAATLGFRLGSQAELLTVSRGLEATVGKKVAGRVSINDGAASFSFEESVDTGKVVVPSAFVIEVPVFNGAHDTYILAKLRFRIHEGLVIWSIDLHDMTTVFAEAAEVIRAEIEAAGHRAVLGTP